MADEAAWPATLTPERLATAPKDVQTFYGKPNWATGLCDLQAIRKSDGASLMAHAKLIAAGKVAIVPDETDDFGAYVSTAELHAAETQRIFDESMERSAREAEAQRNARIDAALAKERARLQRGGRPR